MTREDVRVDAIEPQLGHRRFVEAREPHTFYLAHHHVGHDVARLGVGEFRTRPRIEALDQPLHIAQHIVVARRTIAKYREGLQIPPVNLRKSL